MKYIITFFIIKQIFSDLCGIDHQCGSCEYCSESASNDCSCNFYNGFCYNNTKNGYSYNSSYLFKYDRNKCLSNIFEDICGKSDISDKLNNKNFYNFFSFNNTGYLNQNNLLCYYTFNNKEKSKEDLILDIEVNSKKEDKLDNGMNLLILFVQELDSPINILYEINLNEITQKVSVKLTDQYQFISMYISLIKNNKYLNNSNIISMSIGAKKDNSKLLREKKYKYSLIIICIICIICFASCFILYIIRYKRNRELMTLRAINLANNLNALENHMDPQEKKRKLEKLFKTMLKKKKYLKKYNINETTACSICLEEFVENKSIVCITPCMHIFHYDCLHNWLFTDNSKCQCPYCNYDLLSDKKPLKRHKKEEINNITNKPDKGDIMDSQNIANDEKNNEITNRPKNENDENYNTSERVIKKMRNNKNKNKINDINNNIENNINNEINIVDEEIKNDMKEKDDNDISFENDFNKIKNNENIMKNFKENKEMKNCENSNDINNNINNEENIKGNIINSNIESNN